MLLFLTQTLHGKHRLSSLSLSTLLALKTLLSRSVLSFRACEESVDFENHV